ncbi:MAG: ABC transporter substrate-binding protein [Paracoccaceae bacterium]|nr:ABC transporter substrate-binding protein [Paracoccaceae bacterium]
MTDRFYIGAIAAFAILAGQTAKADITVYTAGPAKLIDKLSAGFTAKTGVPVHVFQATTGKVMARLAAEASNPVADVVISASWGTATSFAKQGLLLAYTSPNAAEVPAFLKTDTAVAQGVSALAIAWNPKSGTPKPAEWSDLEKPAYKNLVNLPDPAQSGSAFELTSTLEASQGDGLFKGLAANGAIVAGANAAALNPVMQGAKAAVFGAVDYIALGAKAKGESIDVIFPKSGTVIAPRPAMILKSSKHADEAKKFIDYMLSDEGQTMVAATYLMPARTDVAAKRPRIDELTVLPVDHESVYGKRKETLDAFAKLFAK